jgi:hypothetical protein
MLVSLMTLALLGTAQAAQPQQETAFSCQTAFMTSTIVEGTPIPILQAGPAQKVEVNGDVTDVQNHHPHLYDPLTKNSLTRVTVRVTVCWVMVLLDDCLFVMLSKRAIQRLPCDGARRLPETSFDFLLLILTSVPFGICCHFCRDHQGPDLCCCRSVFP